MSDLKELKSIELSSFTTILTGIEVIFALIFSIIISIAIIAFVLVDLNVIDLTETEATVLTNQPILADYNEEAYVVEGIPETADIVLMGNKAM